MSSSDSDSNVPSEQIHQGAWEGLEGEKQLTPEEREAIAATIQSEIAQLLPELPQETADIANRAMGLALSIVDKLGNLDNLDNLETDTQEES